MHDEKGGFLCKRTPCTVVGSSRVVVVIGRALLVGFVHLIGEVFPLATFSHVPSIKNNLFRKVNKIWTVAIRWLGEKWFYRARTWICNWIWELKGGWHLTSLTWYLGRKEKCGFHGSSLCFDASGSCSTLLVIEDQLVRTLEIRPLNRNIAASV